MADDVIIIIEKALQSSKCYSPRSEMVAVS